MSPKADKNGETPFLNVSKSAMGRRWVERAFDGALALSVAQRLGTDEIIGRLLAARGVSASAAPNYLNPSLKNDMPDPTSIRDMDRAAERIANAMMRNESVAVFGDYDVDGATSSALLVRFFRELGNQTQVYIPDRLTEGYGPNVEAMQKLVQGGAKLIITVDCGTQAIEALAAAKKMGCDVIVCDHHLPGDHLPEAYAIINPNRTDDGSGLGQLAAVGVAFMLCVAVNRDLRNQNWFHNKSEPDLIKLLPIVALGTVADVVPLTGLNRTFVARGLLVAKSSAIAGIEALREVGRISGALEPYHLGFVLGPRVNAGGRVGRCDLGSRLLATEDKTEAFALAAELNALNDERREIERKNLDEAIAIVESNEIIRNAHVIVVAHDKWHPGVIGVVAGRLKERYGKPVIVIAISNGVGKGSGRSISGVDLGSAIVAARETGILINGGGHKMAAGITIHPDKVDALALFLSDRLRDECLASGEERVHRVDGAVSPAGVTIEFCDLLSRCGPYGAGNSEPIFALPSLRVSYASVVGESHVRCVLNSENGERLPAIAFRAVETELGSMLLNSKGRSMHVLASFKADEWNERRRVQATIKDAAYVM